MRKVLAIASVGIQHKQMVLKDLKNIFKRIRIPQQILLQEEIPQNANPNNNNPLFKSFPYITLTIPNYEQHRSYLQKVYKNNVLFSKFILLISKGDNYDQLIINRDEEILREQCRNWNSKVSCEFESSSVFTEIEQQMSKIDKIFGEMDIRGKISKIDAQKKFHLIQDHLRDNDDHPTQDCNVPSQKVLHQLFFGFELAKRGNSYVAKAGGITIAEDSRSLYPSEFMEYEEETDAEPVMKMDHLNFESPKIMKQNIQVFSLLEPKNERADLCGKRIIKKRACKRRLDKLSIKNPYLKKKFADEGGVVPDLTVYATSN